MMMMMMMMMMMTMMIMVWIRTSTSSHVTPHVTLIRNMHIQEKHINIDLYHPVVFFPWSRLPSIFLLYKKTNDGFLGKQCPYEYKND